MTSLFYLSECGSTNDEIVNFLSEEVSLTCVFTTKQTKGRGQYGNSWESSEAINLAISFAVNTQKVLVSQNLFNYHTANILCEFIDKLTDYAPKIKWPNDIILKNKKISGMLIERIPHKKQSYYVIGIGINVLQKKFDLLPNAGSLYTQTQKKFDTREIAQALFSEMEEKLFQNVSNEEILEKFNTHLFKKGEISVFEKSGIRQNGIIKEADENGNLWIDLEKEGLQKFFHKEIAMLY